MTYNEKRQNNSLERLIWNNYILSQNYSISKTQISKLYISSIWIHIRKSSLNWITMPHLALSAEAKRLLKSWLKRLIWPIFHASFPFQLQLSFESSVTSILNMIFLNFPRLCLRMSMPSLREKWALLRKILITSISSLSLNAEHRLSSEITFCATIELFVVRWKSLLWICLVPTITWLNSYFALEFLDSG